jgi:serine/threonine protein phosphatase 1
MNKVLRLPLQSGGRTFAVGDIHGSYPLLLSAMEQADFDKSRDRLLLVGDLIDRGSASYRCTEFLALPYVHAVRGNHEQMLISLFEEEGMPDRGIIDALAKMNYNGMGWLKNMSIEELLGIVEVFKKLPIAMHVETERGTVGVVHADVPQGMHWEQFLQKIEAGDPYVTDFALGMLDESRDRVESNRQDGVEGVDRLFVGHTVQPHGLCRYGNVYAIDTGACFAEAGRLPGGHLTLANVTMSTQFLCQPHVPTHPLIDVRHVDDVPQRSFSSLTALRTRVEEPDPDTSLEQRFMQF